MQVNREKPNGGVSDAIPFSSENIRYSVFDVARGGVGGGGDAPTSGCAAMGFTRTGLSLM